MSASARSAPIVLFGIGLRWPTDIGRLGSWSLVGLAALLPFELTQRPLLHAGLTITDLKLWWYAVVVLGAVAVMLHMRQVLNSSAIPKQLGRRGGRGGGPPAPARWAGSYTRLGIHSLARWSTRGKMSAVLALLLGWALLSAVMGADRQNGLKWCFDLALGGLLWLAIPRLLAGGRGQRIHHIEDALIAGATAAAVIGLAEVMLRAQVEPLLIGFKQQPSVIGPYLRLSGTFEYANIAGGYFATILPIAVARASERTRAPVAERALRLLAIPILLAALLSTFSRGALFGFACGLIVLVIATRRRICWSGSLPMLAGTVVMLVAAGGIIAFTPATHVLSLRVATESDVGWYGATFQSTVPARARPAVVLHIPVTVRNTGSLTWQPHGRHPYHLGYHWLLPSGYVAVFDGLRTSLPRAVPPGGQVTVRGVVATPPKPGTYRLVWDVVSEQLTWFAMKTGAYQLSPVTISGAPGTVRVPSPPGSEPTVLPSAPPQPGREMLWAAAVRMIAGHPLLGVGPDAYRLLYGRYMRPAITNWDTRILANSLPLELASDIGLIGLLLFLVFVVGAVRRPFVAVWRGNLPPSLAALPAAIAVILGHGTVDYLLAAHAMFILFWLLLGMMAAVRWLPEGIQA